MKKILVVEDELSYLHLLHDQLTQEGYDVIDAHDGKEGLALAKEHAPDLILLDIRMPVMDGMTMLTLLRGEKGFKNSKVILLTNIEPDGKVIGEVMLDQPLYYFVKSDIKLHTLLEKIKTVLA